MTIAEISQVRRTIRTFKDLEVYQEGFGLSLEMFRLTETFPKEERYGLCTQMRNAARSIPANIAEGWAKRKHEMVFKRHLLDAIGSNSEMFVWLDTARSCDYIAPETHRLFTERYESLGRRLHRLAANWKTF